MGYCYTATLLLLLLGSCACIPWQANAFSIFGRAATVPNQEAADAADTEPSLQGRIWNLYNDDHRRRPHDHDRDRDNRPIIITTNPSQGQPGYPHYPYPQHPQPYPMLPPAPPTIYQPIIQVPRPSHHHHHGHEYGENGPYNGIGGAFGRYPFINITYAPVLSAPTTSTTTNDRRSEQPSPQINELTQLLQYLNAQNSAADTMHGSQQVSLYQAPQQAVAASNAFASAQQYYPSALDGNFDDFVNDEAGDENVYVNANENSQLPARRKNKTKSKSRKRLTRRRKNSAQMLYAEAAPNPIDADDLVFFTVDDVKNVFLADDDKAVNK